MSYIPPFTITTDILNLVANISQQVGMLDATINAPINVTINTEADIAGLSTPDAVLALVAKNPELTRQQLASIIGKDVRTIARALAALQQAGKVKRIGSNKTGHWKVYL